MDRTLSLNFLVGKNPFGFFQTNLKTDVRQVLSIYFLENFFHLKQPPMTESQYNLSYESGEGMKCGQMVKWTYFVAYLYDKQC